MFEDFLVIEDHQANGVNQLTVKTGDVVRVIKKEETGVVKYCFHCVRVCIISKLIVREVPNSWSAKVSLVLMHPAIKGGSGTPFSNSTV